jgi:hypothetical protein
MVLRTSLGAMHRHLKNNTPVNTEVLWGCGLWWGLRAGAPLLKQVQQIVNVNLVIHNNVSNTWSGAVLA